MSSTIVRSPAYTPDIVSRAEVEAQPAWHPATRYAFRICFVYFGLYVLLTQMLGSALPIPGWQFPELGLKAPFRQLTYWIGTHMLGMPKWVDPPVSGSGDRMFYWVQAYELLVVSLLAAAVWSYVAPERTNHDRLYRWFRVFVRIALGTSFLSYGFAKVVPLQMPNQLMRLVEPYGNVSMMGVLWASIGSSPAYEIFTGLAELGAGALLLLPMTARFGALLGLMDATAVFVLNMTYDVPVKLFSFHLILMSFFLVAPVARTLFELFILNRASRIPPEPAVGPGGRARRAQWVFAVYVLAIGAHGSWKAWTMYGGGAPRSALYGIWDVRTMSVDGALIPPLVTDSSRWHRAIFDSPQLMVMQRMNDQFRYYRATIDSSAHRLILAAGDTTKPKPTFTYRKPDRAHLVLDGTMNGRAVHMELAYRNPATFVQRGHGFNWVQEFPYNR